MVNVLTPPALILVAFGSLSACGDIKGALDFVDARDDFENRIDRLQSRSNTAYLAIPETGSTTFTGEATLGVGTPENGIVLLGDAAVTVNFDDNDVTGELTNFSGFDSGEDFSTYSGSLTLENGQVGAVNPNDVDAQIVGTLVGDAATIDVDAFWEGHLKGTPIIGILGDTTSAQSDFLLNGNDVNGGMVIAVTN